MNVFIVFFSLLSFVQADVDCYSLYSSLSGTNDGDTVSITCQAAGYTLTGCSAWSDDRHLDGSYFKKIDNVDYCFAENGKDGNGVKAIARCCNIKVQQCQNYDSILSLDDNDAQTTVSCDPSLNEVLVGCTHFSSLANGKMDGAFAGLVDEDTYVGLYDCTAQNGKKGDGVYANAQCCIPEHNTALLCWSKWSPPSGSIDNSVTSIGCDYGFMASCSAYTSSKYIDGAWIGDDDLCYAQNGKTGVGKSVQAVGICCQEFLDPTKSPTPSPTEMADPSCLNGIRNNNLCCASFCGQCGGAGCGNSGGGASNCCYSAIAESERICTQNSAPCLIVPTEAPSPSPTEIPDPNCLNGIQNNDVCCASFCDQCGGSDCGIPHGSSNCCLTGVRNSGRICTQNSAPCVIE